MDHLPGSRWQLQNLSQNKDWDNDNQTTPVTDLFSYAYVLSPAPSSFVYLNL
jgi:hypothetical protein